MASKKAKSPDIVYAGRKYRIAWSTTDRNVHNAPSNLKMMARELLKDLFRSSSTTHIEVFYRGKPLGVWFREAPDSYELEQAFLFYFGGLNH
jgi:hypothetical protein